MRSVGLGLAIAATVQFVLVSTPAFAQPPAPATDPVASTPVDAAQDVRKPAPPKEPVAPAPVSASGMITVHIQASKPVALERRAQGHDAWEQVCTSPCDKAFSASDEYRVSGDGLNESRPFQLETAAGDKVTLDVHRGKKSAATAGTWVLIGGSALVVGGVITLIAGSSSNDAPGGNGTTTTDKNTNVIFVGTTLILGGVILGITGGSLMLDNAHTRVDGAIDSRPDGKSHDKVDAELKVTASRLPTWHEERGPALAPVTNIVPIIHTTF